MQRSSLGQLFLERQRLEKRRLAQNQEEGLCVRAAFQESVSQSAVMGGRAHV